MPATRTIALAATLGLLTIGAAAGCTGIFNRLEDGVVRDGAFTGVSIAGGSGDVTVTTDAAVKGIDIRRTVRYLKNPPSTNDTITFTGGVVALKTECGSQCSASYQVRVPTAGLKVDGSNGSGNIRLQGVSDVDVRLGSGQVTVDGASGSVRVKAGSGNVELSDIAGPVTVNSGSGNVTASDLRGTTTTIDVSSGDVSLDVPGTGDVKAVTSSGHIDVLVPDHTCRVTAHSSSGDLSIQVSSEPASTHLIDLRTGSGNVTVKPTAGTSR